MTIPTNFREAIVNNAQVQSRQLLFAQNLVRAVAIELGISEERFHELAAMAEEEARKTMTNYKMNKALEAQ